MPNNARNIRNLATDSIFDEKSSILKTSIDGRNNNASNLMVNR